MRQLLHLFLKFEMKIDNSLNWHRNSVPEIDPRQSVFTGTYETKHSAFMCKQKSWATVCKHTTVNTIE